MIRRESTGQNAGPQRIGTTKCLSMCKAGKHSSPFDSLFMQSSVLYVD